MTSYWKIGSHVAAQRLEIFSSSLAKKTQEDIALYSWPRIADIAEEMLRGMLLKNAPDKEHNFAKKCPTSSDHRLTCPKTSIATNT